MSVATEEIDMNAVEKMAIKALIEMELKQGWDCLGVEQFDLAKKHILEAAAKIDEFVGIAANATKTEEQIVLIEDVKHEEHQLTLDEWPKQ